jgi:hypothetical protein
MRLGLLLVALAACSVPQPSNEEVDAPPGADEAAAIVVAEWSERLGVGLDVSEMPVVRWFEGPCLDYGDGCESVAGGHLDGGYAYSLFADAEIHLLFRPTVHQTSLVHEVLHWALDESGVHSDASHRSWAWGDVGEVMVTLAEAGL